MTREPHMRASLIVLNVKRIHSKLFFISCTPDMLSRSVPTGIMKSGTFVLKTSNGLCDHCQVLELNDIEHGGFVSTSGEGVLRLQFPGETLDLNFHRIDKLRDMPSLNATKDAGCQFCRLLIASFRNHYGPIMHELDGIEDIEICGVSYRAEMGLSGLRVDFRCKGIEPTRREWLDFAITAYPSERYECLSQLQMANYSGSTTEWLRISERPRYEILLTKDGTKLHRDVKNRIMSWIKECDSHSHPLSKKDALPTRLLDLQSLGVHGAVRLIETSAHATKFQGASWKYATLSHCWGSPDNHPLRTTTENIDEMSKTIPFDILPSNYQDAVTVCRSLDIPYIWIDSLCIIQNDKQDWELESPNMAGIYEQAYVTLIPTVANTCHDGFLGRSPLPSAAAIIPYRTRLKPIRQGFYLIEEHGWNINHFTLGTTQTKWGSRGWTFTEQLFSTRRLYFGANGMHWSCDNAYCTELLHGSHLPCEYSVRSSAKAIERSGNYLSLWYRGISDYSSRSLTEPRDRLPAISAFAKRIADISGDRYLAGLWQTDLSFGLLWQSNEHHDPPVLPGAEAYIAPSWSWLAQARRASMRSSDWFPSVVKVRSFIQVLEARTVLDGINPFGRIRDGYLTLRSKVYCLAAEVIHFNGRSGGGTWETISDGSLVAYCSFDGEDQSRLLSEWEFKIKKVLLLAVRVDQCLNIPSEQPAVSGLILIPSGRRDREYCRIGIFESHPSKGGGIELFERCETWTVTIV